jgi:hypothetical protein
MAIRRRPYDIPLTGGGPGFRRALLLAFGVAALLGLIVGVGWVVAGLVHYYVVR